MRHLIVALTFLALPAAAFAVCPYSGPTITHVDFANYFQQGVWPAHVTVKGPNPFPPHTLENLPQFYSSFQPWTAIDNAPLSLWKLTTKVDANGCHVAFYGAQPIVDAPFSPLVCVSGFPQYCGQRVGETLEVYAWDSTGAEAEVEANCKWITRGSFCNYNE